MSANNEASTHSGVYGVVIHQENVLLIRKRRGPYTGLLDLPGGAREPGESDECALKREFQEEVGCEPRIIEPWSVCTIEVNADSNGRAIHFRHIATWVAASLDEQAVLNVVSDESDGTQWVALRELPAAPLSALARHVLINSVTKSILT